MFGVVLRRFEQYARLAGTCDASARLLFQCCDERWTLGVSDLFYFEAVEMTDEQIQRSDDCVYRALVSTISWLHLLKKLSAEVMNSPVPMISIPSPQPARSER